MLLQAGAARLAAVAVLVHALCTQLAGPGAGADVGAHEPKLQAAESESTPHEPPCVAAVMVKRVRVFVPSPHALLQSP